MRLDIYGFVAKGAIAVGSFLGTVGAMQVAWAQSGCFATQACTTNGYTGPTGFYCQVPQAGNITTDPFTTGLYRSSGLCADEYDVMGQTGTGCGDTFAKKC